jgi:hypothetical protein
VFTDGIFAVPELKPSGRSWNPNLVSQLGYPPSSPVVVACCTASLRDETPSFR